MPHRVIHGARQLRGIAAGGNAERDTAGNSGRRLHSQPLAEQRGETRDPGVRFEIPRGCFESRARKPVAAYAIPHHRVHCLWQ